MTNRLFAMGLGLLLLAACRRATHPTGEHVLDQGAPHDQVDREVLARWARSGAQLGMDCLDERIRLALVATAQSGKVPRDQVLINPSPELLETTPRALPVYVVEIEKEPTYLHEFRDRAKTTDYRPSNTLSLPIIIVDKNLLRWIGARLEHLLSGAMQVLDEMKQDLAQPGGPGLQPISALVGVLSNSWDGGFGLPLGSFTSAPKALARYCIQKPTGADLIILSLALDQILWTLRHEMFHAWNPTPLTESPKSCPDKEVAQHVAASEIGADTFAVHQMKEGDLDNFLAPWKYLIDQWRERYDPEGEGLSLHARRGALAYFVGHHELSTILQGQAERSSPKDIWLGVNRYNNMRSHGNLEADGSLNFIRALKLSQECPKLDELERQCKLCPSHDHQCEKAINLSWKCAVFRDVSIETVSKQQRWRKEAFDYLRASGFRVKELPEEGNIYLEAYRIDREGDDPIGAGSLYGNLTLSETEDVSESSRQVAFCTKGAARNIGGLSLFTERGCSQSAINLLLEWETKRNYKDCQAGDLTACRWLGAAHFAGRGTHIDYKAANLAYGKACVAKDGNAPNQAQATANAACMRQKELRWILRRACENGDKKMCSWWSKVFSTPARPAKKRL